MYLENYTEIVAVEDLKAGDVIMMKDNVHGQVRRVHRGKDAVLLVVYMPDKVSKALCNIGDRVARLNLPVA